MAGLYTLSGNSVKNMSIGQLDQLMDEAVINSAGKLSPSQAAVVPVAYKAVRKISGAVARMPYYIENEREDDVTDEYTPRYWKQLNSRIASSLLKWGAAYCLKETNRYGLNTQWRFLPAPMVRYHLDGSNEIDYFEYASDGKVERIYDFNKRLLWWWWPNDESEIGPGWWPLYSAMRDIGLADNLTKFAESYFARGGFPVTLLQFEGNLGEGEGEKVLSWWDSKLRGAKNAFKSILLTKKITPNVIGTNIKDTIAPDMYNQSIRNVGLAFDIPMTLLMSDASNYATSLQDHVEFYTDNVIPMTEMIYEVWNERVYEPQGLTIEVWPDDLEIMQSYQLEQAAAVVPLVGSPVLTVKEGRQLLGYETAQDATQTQADAQAVVFNGAQVQAASDIVVKVSSGELPRNSGIAMLVSFFGMTEQQAAQIIGDAGSDSTDATPQPEQPAQPVAATTAPQAAQPDEMQDDAIETERKALRRYAHNRLRDGKPFAFRSDVIGAAEIEAVKALTTHDEIDALDLTSVKRGPDLAQLIDAINAARLELKAAANG